LITIGRARCIPLHQSHCNQEKTMTTEFSSSPGQIEGPKETLASNLKGIAAKADDLIKKAGHTVAEEFAATRSIVSEKACGAASSTDAYVRGNPWKIVGVAAAAGLIIGGLLSRRRLP
jgi:ElaB/YqjD/DUF883 family membrane-anchored ribosome-binding protein